jgi:hypothetical protein
MIRRRLGIFATLAIMLLGGAAWMLTAYRFKTFAILSACPAIILSVAFTEWANGREVLTKWPKRKPPEK